MARNTYTATITPRIRATLNEYGWEGGYQITTRYREGISFRVVTPTNPRLETFHIESHLNHAGLWAREIEGVVWVH